MHKQKEEVPYVSASLLAMRRPMVTMTRRIFRASWRVEWRQPGWGQGRLLRAENSISRGLKVGKSDLSNKLKEDTYSTVVAMRLKR